MWIGAGGYAGKTLLKFGGDLLNLTDKWATVRTNLAKAGAAVSREAFDADAFNLLAKQYRDALIGEGDIKTKVQASIRADGVIADAARVLTDAESIEFLDEVQL